MRRHPADLLLQPAGHLVEVDGRQPCARAPLRRLPLAENHRLEPLRPAARRASERSEEHIDDRVGQRQAVIRPQRLELRHRHAVRHQEDRHVAHDLARGRHLHDVAESAVHVGVGVCDLRPAIPESHPLGLLAQICVLPAGHLVQVHRGRP